ncbi:GTP-binding protein, partial [Methanosalsum natronophilum]
MKIAIIGGFLGSGKTTSIIELGRYLSENNHKIAILVNEIGEIGLDGDTISGSGIQTKELTSGCICCSLKIDLEITLNSLIEDFSPDIVLIEPTGIAFPGQIKEDISSMDCSTNFSFAPIICLVDGNRFSTEFSQIPKFVVTQLEESEVIGINKIDVTPIDKIQETIERIADINSTAKI